MPPRSRQQGRKPVQSVPLPDVKDKTVTSEPQPDPAQNTPQTAPGGPESPVQTFVAESDAVGVQNASWPLAAPERQFPPQESYERKPVVGNGNAVPQGRILRGTEPFTFEGTKVGETIICTENVYREVFYTGTKRPSYVIIAHRGQRFTGKSMVNLTEEQAKTDGVA